MLTTVVIGLVGVLVYYVLEVLVLKPQRITSKLQKQGIKGPPSYFLFGNVFDLVKKKKIEESVPENDNAHEINHDYFPTLFPFFHECQNKYGPVFVLFLGNNPVLFVNKPEVVKAISVCRSLGLGKPTYQRKLFRTMLGLSIATSNGEEWAVQRKTAAPEFTTAKVKGRVTMMMECAIKTVDSLNQRIDMEGSGVADLKIDEFTFKFSADIISRVCFGKDYQAGLAIVSSIITMTKSISTNHLLQHIPGMRFLPTKSHRMTLKLEKEIHKIILRVVNERRKEPTTTNHDLLQSILETTKTLGLSEEETDRYVTENFKFMYLAGQLSNAVTETWTMMLLAAYPEWQARIRNEALQVSPGNQWPDPDSVQNLKTVNMFVHESLRLYPIAAIVSKEALEDMEIGGIHVPKGVPILFSTKAAHQDPEVWGRDADKFNPERFANGVSGATMHPYMFMPFGLGHRSCLGQNMAMAELKILVTYVASRFSLSLSPKYRHSVLWNVTVEPAYGVDLLVRKL